MFQSICFIAFIANLAMTVSALGRTDWIGVFAHGFCALLCSIGFVEFKKKGE